MKSPLLQSYSRRGASGVTGRSVAGHAAGVANREFGNASMRVARPSVVREIEQKSGPAILSAVQVCGCMTEKCCSTTISNNDYLHYNYSLELYLARYLDFCFMQ